MKKTALLLVAVLLFCSVFSLAACKKDGPETKYTLSENEVTLKVGETLRLSFLDDGITVVDSVVWDIDNKSVATVNDGNIVAKSVGDAKITAEYNGFTLTCHLKVLDKDAIGLSKSSLVLEVGRDFDLTLDKSGVPLKEGVTWKAQDSAVATVDGGKVKGIAIGETIITALYGSKSYMCTVEVVAPFNPVGDFFASYEVSAMNTTFEFDLKIKDDGTYTYSRRKVGIHGAKDIASGKWSYSEQVLVLENNGEEMKFSVKSADKIASIGEITTGGMKDAELVFDRIK